MRTDRRYDRRALTVDEIRRLSETTTAQPERFGMTGPGRAMLYRLAVETGLRANELRTLKASSFDFDNCSVVVEAAYSKHRRRDVLPLRPDTANELRAFIGCKLPAALVFDMPKLNRLVKMLRADLEDAGIAYVDESGRYADFPLTPAHYRHAVGRKRYSPKGCAVTYETQHNRIDYGQIYAHAGRTGKCGDCEAAGLITTEPGITTGD